jgi:cation diffusion facilitator CzcD-associated flavoprotein CzcO
MHIPRIDGIESFQGSEICHSSSFKGIKDCSTGKKVVVIGSGNSAHDIAHRCCLNGLEVTMVQRSSTCVDPTEYSKGKDLYKEDGPRTEDADLATYSLPNAVSKRHQMEGTDKLYKDHSAFFEGLHKAGFVTDRGPGGAG